MRWHCHIIVGAETSSIIFAAGAATATTDTAESIRHNLRCRCRSGYKLLNLALMLVLVSLIGFWSWRCGRHCCCWCREAVGAAPAETVMTEELVGMAAISLAVRFCGDHGTAWFECEGKGCCRCCGSASDGK